jgi:hypothetical protein
MRAQFTEMRAEMRAMSRDVNWFDSCVQFTCLHSEDVSKYFLHTICAIFLHTIFAIPTRLWTIYCAKIMHFSQGFGRQLTTQFPNLDDNFYSSLQLERRLHLQTVDISQICRHVWFCLGIRSHHIGCRQHLKKPPQLISRREPGSL